MNPDGKEVGGVSATADAAAGRDSDGQLAAAEWLCMQNDLTEEARRKPLASARGASRFVAPVPRPLSAVVV